MLTCYLLLFRALFHAGGDDSIIQSFVATLGSAKLAIRKLILQTSGNVAHLAFQLGDCAVAADVSRFCIKRLETSSVAATTCTSTIKVRGNRDDGKSSTASSGGVGSTTSKGLTAAESVRAKEQARAEEAVVWMTRALAFAGMGK